MNRLATVVLAGVLIGGCGRHRESDTGPRAADAAVAVQGPAPVSYAFQSDIPYCLEVTGKGTVSDANLLLAIVEIKTRRITAECGCTSRGLLWRSVTSPKGIETEYASGDLLAPEPGGPATERRVVLLGDRAYPPAEPLLVHVGCAPAP